MINLNKNSLAISVIIFSILGLIGPPTLYAAEAPIDLLSASNFVILSKAGITNVPTSAITGNIGTSPITGASIAGLDCVEVTGVVYTVDATGPVCRTTDATLLGTAVSDMEAAYTNAAGRPAGVGAFLNVGAGTVSGMTRLPGIYTWDSNVAIPTNLTLDAQGDANAVWIFQIAGTLTIATDKQVILTGSAQAPNVFWQVADAVTLGAGSHFEGTMLAQTSIAMITGATLTGRALAQTAVTLQANVATLGTIVPVSFPSIGNNNGKKEITSQLIVNTPFSPSSLADEQTPDITPPHVFTRNLIYGSSGDEVKELQNRLLGTGYFKYQVTGYFGQITKKALQTFQSKNKLPAFGFFGPMTRTLLNT